MHLPTALPELWVTESPLGEPEPLLILRRHTRVPRQALPGPHGGREKAKTFPSVASDAGGPRSAKLQVWSCAPSHFSSPSGGGCIRQLQFCKCSVRLAHIPAHPVSLPSVMGTHWLAAAGESLGVCATPTQNWQSFSAGLWWTQEGCSPGPSHVRRAACCAARSSQQILPFLAHCLSSGPHQRLQISVILLFLAPISLCGIYKESLNVGGNLWRSLTRLG